MSTIYDQVIMFFETYKETLTDDAKAAILPTVEYARGQLFGKIPKAELKHGAYYFGRSRNADTARWDARRNVFAYRRTKFGHTYGDTLKMIASSIRSSPTRCSIPKTCQASRKFHCHRKMTKRRSNHGPYIFRAGRTENPHAARYARLRSQSAAV
jgi:hypothetical protein